MRFSAIADALSRGERVELRGFGAFSAKQRRARTGRNARTGDKVSVTEKRALFFKTGKDGSTARPSSRSEPSCHRFGCESSTSRVSVTDFNLPPGGV
jgi:hypothetical protein